MLPKTQIEQACRIILGQLFTRGSDSRLLHKKIKKV